MGRSTAQPSRQARVKRSLYLWALLMLPACSSPLDLGLWKREKPLLKADADHPVSEIIGIWQPGEGPGLDGLPSRGFAGQILFFARGYKEPVITNGDVSIYVFDDFGDTEEQQKPIHIFNFSAGAWQKYSRESSLGASYQVFIPYTRPGNHGADCQIKVKFTTPEGKPVFSRDAHVLLSGNRQHKAAQRTAPPQLQQVVQPAAHTTGANSGGVVAANYEVPAPPQGSSISLPLPTSAPRPAPDLSRLEQLLNDAAGAQ